MNAICAASSVVIQEFPDVPTFLGAGDKEKGNLQELHCNTVDESLNEL